MTAREEAEPSSRFTLEADTQAVNITLAEDFFHDIDTVAFDERVARTADAVRTALYTIAGFDSTRH